MAEVCKVYEPHWDRIRKAKKKLPKKEKLQEMADFFDAFSNSTRLEILFSLINGELCTCDLSNITGISVSAISHQLRILRDRRIVTYRKEGKNVFYKLEDKHIMEILQISLEHMGE